MTETCELTATDISKAYQAGKLSPVEVLQSVRARVEQTEPLLSACWAVNFDEAMEVAQASEQRCERKRS